MKTMEKELQETINAWPRISKVLSTLNSEGQYRNAVRLLDRLIDELAVREDPTIESLADTIGTLIKDYEDRKIKEPDSDPVGCLKFLMEEHKLKQSDLKELGSQGVVSEILNGKRRLNVRQIKALCQRFNVSPSVFI